MKALLLLSALSGCSHGVTSVTSDDWYYCEEVCLDSSAKEACHSVFKGLGCTCLDGTTTWNREPY